MLTPFGRFIRKLRIDRGELLKEMADKLGVTSSYLSAVENGKRNVPQKWVNEIPRIYSLDQKNLDELTQTISKSQIINKVNIKEMKNDDRELMMALARKIEGMNEEDKGKIRKILVKES